MRQTLFILLQIRGKNTAGRCIFKGYKTGVHYFPAAENSELSCFLTSAEKCRHMETRVVRSGREHSLNIYMLFAGREIRIGKNCARDLEYSRPSAQFFPIRADLGRQITCLFFSSVEYFVSSFCVEFSLQPFSNLVYACV